tara:strand:- start:316 stop:480 length:165 start_codon:yes stop_codon:yes gene_type:complete
MHTTQQIDSSVCVPVLFISNTIASSAFNAFMYFVLVGKLKQFMIISKSKKVKSI